MRASVGPLRAGRRRMRQSLLRRCFSGCAGNYQPYETTAPGAARCHQYRRLDRRGTRASNVRVEPRYQLTAVYSDGMGAALFGRRGCRFAEASTARSASAGARCSADSSGCRERRMCSRCRELPRSARAVYQHGRALVRLAISRQQGAASSERLRAATRAREWISRCCSRSLPRTCSMSQGRFRCTTRPGNTESRSQRTGLEALPLAAQGYAERVLQPSARFLPGPRSSRTNRRR